MYLCPGISANEAALFQSQSTNLFNVAPLLPKLPNEEAFHALPAQFYDFNYAGLTNSTLECMGTIGTDNGTAIVTLFDIAAFEALPFESVLPPDNPDNNGRWGHSVSPKREWDIYRVETAGGTTPICDGKSYMVEKEYTAEYWFFYSGGEDLWIPNNTKRKDVARVQNLSALI